MSMKPIYVRFDIDTITCMDQGVPRLLDLAARLDVGFTFFVNLGRSIDRNEVLYRSASRTVDNVRGGTKKISVLKKLGVLDTLRTLVFNPEVGSRRHDLLRQLLESGHELGLHGGGNHGTWQRTGGGADGARFGCWVQEKLTEYRRHVPLGGGFASPGAAANDELYPVLQKQGFAYSSDDFGSREIYQRSNGLWEVPVTAHFETVPFIEHFRAAGHDAGEVVAKMVKWASENHLRTFYGHPVWEGFRDQRLFERILKTWIDQGFQIRPYGEALA